VENPTLTGGQVNKLKQAL